MRCKNCTKELIETDHFCRFCGAKVIRKRLNFKNIWQDFTEQFLNYDNKFLKTYLTLWRKPDEVMSSYIQGVRKKYVNVITYFTIAITLSGFQLFILQKFFPEALDLGAIVPDTPGRSEMNFDWIYEYYSIFVLINMPLYALIARLTFIGLKKLNYTEHLVVITYAISQFSITNFIVLTITSSLDINYYIAGNIMNIFMFIYVSYVYKKLYPLTLPQIVLRCLLFFAALIVLSIIAGIIQFVIMYLTGDFHKILEAEKAKRATTYIASSIINWTS